MNKIRRVIFLVVIIYIVNRVFFLVSAGLSYSPEKRIEEPLDYKEIIIQTNSKLKYSHTKTKGNSLPISLYIYDDKYNLVIFKKKTEIFDLSKGIKFFDEKKDIDYDRFYSVFMSEKFNYILNNEEIIKGIDVFIDGFDSKSIIKKNKDEIYLSFLMKSTLSISFNGENIDLYSEVLDSKFKEFNELMIFYKEGYTYFVYLKPFKKVEKKKIILNNLIKREFSDGASMSD
ncbi:hypothetical protein BTO06_16340 [Tenacibaculum sp. SZ-18]|uniref:hypothetical protein n=1 Tax=Tenacibaculum sp. SZ-18 TaxID=754423 RepID=UPI000C2CFC6E|nr:hypothetical protein [Tenacibaculum sp. SZ-18]AUC16619.1 hypothetical protein BTO06_16340 [Tenacibaculum sp. SZ-18]